MSKDFFLRDPHAIVDVAENGRLKEIAVLKCAFKFWLLAASQDRRTFFAGDANVALDAIQLFLRNLWAHQSRLVHGVTDLYPFSLFLEACEEFVFHFFFHEQT